MLLGRDADAHAFAHIDHIPRTLEVNPKEIPEPSAEECKIVARADDRERTSGGNRSTIEAEEANLSVSGVPQSAWQRGDRCASIGAVGAARRTDRPSRSPYGALCTTNGRYLSHTKLGLRSGVWHGRQARVSTGLPAAGS